MWFLKLAAFVVVAAWSAVRGVEEALAIWVKRASRVRDLSGVTWA